MHKVKQYTLKPMVLIILPHIESVSTENLANLFKGRYHATSGTRRRLDWL